MTAPVLPISSPAATRLALVRSWLPARAWLSEAAVADRTGLPVAQVRRALERLFEDGEAMRRPATGGVEWKRTNVPA